MKTRLAVVLGVGLLMCSGIFALVNAGCEPQPWCETETCIFQDTDCWPPIQECPGDPYMYAQTEYDVYWCTQSGTIYVPTGWLCTCY